MDSVAFAPGRSPFHIKGAAYEGSRKQYDQLVPGGFNAVAKSLDGQLQEFASQAFFTSSWYDVLPMLQMDAAAAKLCGKSMNRFLEDAVNCQANLDAHGVYRLALRVASPAVKRMPIAFFTRMVSFSHQYFNFSQTKTNKISDNEVEVVTENIPWPIADWFQRSTAQYIAALLRMSGLSALALTYSEPEMMPPLGGMPMARERWRARW